MLSCLTFSATNATRRPCPSRSQRSARGVPRGKHHSGMNCSCFEANFPEENVSEIEEQLLMAKTHGRCSNQRVVAFLRALEPGCRRFGLGKGLRRFSCNDMSESGSPEWSRPDVRHTADGLSRGFWILWLSRATPALRCQFLRAQRQCHGKSREEPVLSRSGQRWGHLSSQKCRDPAKLHCIERKDLSDILGPRIHGIPVVHYGSSSGPTLALSVPKHFCSMFYIIIRPLKLPLNGRMNGMQQMGKGW